MNVLITGACGFVGSALIMAIRQMGLDWALLGFDNLTRPGSEINRAELRRLGIPIVHGDMRCRSDVDALPAVDWMIDCAADPSVLAGVDGRVNSRQLMEHNLLGTLNLLERCRVSQAGFIMLSTSRVYAITPLAALPMEVKDNAFQLVSTKELPVGISCGERLRWTSVVNIIAATDFVVRYPVWLPRSHDRSQVTVIRFTLGGA